MVPEKVYLQKEGEERLAVKEYLSIVWLMHVTAN